MTSTLEYMNKLGFTEQELSSRRAYFQLTDADLARLAALRPFAERHNDGIVDAFYQELLLKHSESRLFFTDQATLQRARTAQKRYFLELFSGAADLSYMENRLQVGTTHQRMGVAPKWYLGAYAHYLRLITERLFAEQGDSADTRGDGPEHPEDHLLRHGHRHRDVYCRWLGRPGQAPGSHPGAVHPRHPAVRARPAAAADRHHRHRARHAGDGERADARGGAAGQGHHPGHRGRARRGHARGQSPAADDRGGAAPRCQHRAHRHQPPGGADHGAAGRGPLEDAHPRQPGGGVGIGAGPDGQVSSGRRRGDAHRTDSHPAHWHHAAGQHPGGAAGHDGSSLPAGRAQGHREVRGAGGSSSTSRAWTWWTPSWRASSRTPGAWRS